MNFKKRPVTDEDLIEFSLVPLLDPVTREASQPKNITFTENAAIYLVSLTNRHISFDHEMPRYFTLNYQGYLVFFFVIDYTDSSEEVTKSIFAKRIKMPKRLIRETTKIRELIIKALFVYYGDGEYKISQIILDDVAEMTYYINIVDGNLTYG